MKLYRIALVIGICLGAGFSFAQEGEGTVKTDKQETRNPQKKGDQKINKLAEDLQLTEEQQAKVREMQENFKVRAKKIKADESTSDEVKKSQMKELKQNKKEQFRAILTKDQIVKLEALKTEKQEARKEKKVTKLASDLELNEEQQKKVRELIDSFELKAKKVREDESLSDEDKKSQAKELKKNHKEQIKAILTADQLVKLETLQAERKEKKEGKKKSLEERAEEKTQKLVEMLSLTEEQTERVRILNLKVLQKIAAVKKNESLTDEQKKEFIKGNKNDHKQQ